jgi:S-adenosyl methyltransferase
MDGDEPQGLADIDTSRPNIARTYDYLLGGCDNFAADRELAAQLLRLMPEMRDVVESNRKFLGRLVTWAARRGITQFIDLGSGMPTRPALDETARTVTPGAHYAYVDNDPVATAHARTMLTTGDGMAVIDGDLTEPAAILGDPSLLAVVDPGQPVCLLLACVLHFYDAGRSREIAAGYVSRIAPGSVVAISGIRNDDPVLWAHLHDAYSAGELYNHTREEAGSFFKGLRVVSPGLVPAGAWVAGVPDGASLKPPGPGYLLAGAGVKL